MPFRTLLLGLLFLPASVASGAGGEAPRCTSDEALSRAAAELIQLQAPPDAETLMRAVRAAGSDAVGVRGLFHADAAREDAWLVRLARDADAQLGCGRASAEGRRALLASARGGTLAPIEPASPRVRGALATGFHAAELVIADGEGALQRFAVDPEQLAAGIAIAEGLRRPVHIQLLARGRLGPRPVAERVLGADAAAPPSSAEAAGAPHDPAGGAAGELDLDRALDALREQAARPPLRHNQLLARAAAQHAAHVCERGQVAHELEPGQDPQQRLRQAGIVARRVGETVARAGSAAAAFEALQQSPSHRLTLLERGFTDGGIGSARADGKHCLVVLLAEWPRYDGR